MATSLGSFSVDVMANIARLESDLGKAKRIADQRAEEMSKAFARAGAAIGTGLAAGLTALAALAKQAINTADEMANMSQKVGVSVESLSTLGYAAKQSDVELQQLQSGLVKLAKNASDAAQGTGTAVNAFSALGVSVKEADGSLKDADDLLKELATRFADYEDGANKTALAVGIFGKAGAELIPLLNEGADGIAELEERARALGLEIGGETADAAERFNDTLEDAANLLKGLGNDIAEAVLPQLNALIAAYVNAGIEGRKAADITDAVRSGFEFLAVTFIKGVEATQNVGAAIGYVVDAVGALLGAVKESTGPLSTYFDALTDVLSGDLVSAAEKYEKALQEAAAVGTSFGLSVKNSGEALKSSFAANASAAQAKIDAMAEATLDLNGAVKETETAARDAAPAIIDLAKAEADATKQAKEAEDAARAYAQMISRAMNEEQDYYARQRKEQEDQARRFDERARDLEQEISLLGLSRAERERLAIAIDAENMARDQNGTLVEAQRQRYEGLLTTLQQAQKIEAAAREFENIWLDAAEGVGDALTTALFDGAENGADALMDVMEQLARDLVRFWLQQNIVIPLQQQLVGGVGGGGGGGMLGGMGGFSEYASTAALAAGGGYLIGGNIFGGSRENAQGGAWGGAVGGIVASTATGAAVIGAGLSAAGMGAALGSVVPVVGTIIGAILGAAIGELFETDPRIRVSATENDARFETAFATGGVARDALPEGTATRFAEAITEFDNALAMMLSQVSTGADQISEIQRELANWSADVSNGGVSIANVLQLRFDAILSTFDEDVQAAVRSAGDLQAQVEALAGAFVYPQQIQQVLSDLANADEWASMTELERQTRAINDQFDAVIEQLETWGASAEQLAQVEAHRANALARLTGAQLENTEAIEEALQSYAEYIDQFGAEFRQGSAFQQSLQDLRRELAANIETANELARAAGLSGAREEDLLAIRQRTERETQALIAGLTETVIQQIAELYGTTAEEFERQIAAIDAEIAAMDRSDSSFGMVQNLMREAQLGAERERLVQEAEAQAAALEALQRQSQAFGLAQNLADLSVASGLSFEQIAAERGLDLARFGADLGIQADAVDDLIRSLAVESLTGDDYFDGVQRIVDAINGAEEKPEDRYLIPDSGPGPKMLREFDVEPIRREEATAELISEVRAMRSELASLRRIEANTGASVTEQRETNRSLRGSALDAQRNTPPNVRVRPKARA